MRKLGRKKQYRTNMLRNMATSLVLYEQLETTIAKAKELRPLIEHLITRAKAEDLNSTRYVHSILFDKKAATKLIKEITPRYKDRKSGFVRIIKLKNRIGDNALIVKIELMDKKIFVDKAEVTKDKAEAKPETDTASVVEEEKVVKPANKGKK